MIWRPTWRSCRRSRPRKGAALIRTRVYPDGQTPQDLVLVAVPDFSDMQVNAITPLQGAWPPGRREIVLERLSFDSLGAQIGREITVELDNDAVRTLKVVGSVHDPAQVNPDLAGATFGYVTPETLVGLGFPEAAHGAAHPRDRARARRAAHPGRAGPGGRPARRAPGGRS